VKGIIKMKSKWLYFLIIFGLLCVLIWWRYFIQAPQNELMKIKLGALYEVLSEVDKIQKIKLTTKEFTRVGYSHIFDINRFFMALNTFEFENLEQNAVRSFRDKLMRNKLVSRGAVIIPAPLPKFILKINSKTSSLILLLESVSEKQNLFYMEVYSITGELQSVLECKFSIDELGIK